MNNLNNYQLQIINNEMEKEDGKVISTCLSLILDDDKVVTSFTIESDNELYSNIVGRMEKLVTYFYRKEYDRQLIIYYLDYLGIGISNNIFKVYDFKFDTLDLVNNTLMRSSRLVGGLVSDRHSGQGYFNSKYSTPTHLKGKYAGYTKAYINLGDLYRSGNRFYFGKNEEDVMHDFDYISLYDVRYSRMDSFAQTNDFNYNNFVLVGTIGYRILHKGSYHYDCAYPSISNNLRYCEKCKTYCDVVDDQGVCNSCRAKGVKRYIHNYGHKPEAKFIRNLNGQLINISNPKFDKFHYYGVEIEIELKRGTSQDMKTIIADEIMNIKTESGVPIFYCKDDSSLDDGFEIVSHPMSYNAWKKFDYAGFIYRYRKYIRSFDTDTAGMHIHVSRNAFNNVDAFKLIRMTYDFPTFSRLIAQRTLEEQRDWASLKHSQVKDMLNRMVSGFRNKTKLGSYGDFKNNYCNGVGGHRGAWNFSNGATAECRLFKGNLSIDGFYKNLEYVESMVQFVKTIGLHECKLELYIGYVKSNRKLYPHLNNFLDENKSKLGNCYKPYMYNSENRRVWGPLSV